MLTAPYMLCHDGACYNVCTLVQGRLCIVMLYQLCPPECNDLWPWYRCINSTVLKPSVDEGARCLEVLKQQRQTTRNQPQNKASCP